MLPFGEMVENLRKISWICKRRSAGGLRFPVKCGNGLLCDLRTRSTEQWLVRAMSGDPCYLVNA
jgi:hypothetical protein